MLKSLHSIPFSHLLFTLLLSSFITPANAQTTPVFTKYDFDQTSIIQAMSDNGRYAIASVTSEGVSQTRIIDLDSHETAVINTDEKTQYGSDISNDASVVVGNVASIPAIYRPSQDKWFTLPTADEYIYGTAYSVSADGTYAVGELYQNNILLRVPALWKLTESGGEIIDIYNNGGLPTKDMTQKDQGMMRFSSISSDNKYILGCMSYSYMPSGDDAGGCFFFVYDRENRTYKPIGFTETATGPWIPKADGLVAILEATMSNNGHYVTGMAHIAIDIEGEYYKNEYDVPYLYDVINDTFTIYDETAAQNTYGTAVSNDGIVLSASPVSTPVREWSLRSGKYWFSFSDVLKQKYNTTFNAETGLDNTGTVNCISNDGKRLAAFPDPYSSYIVDLPEPVTTIGEGMKLLGSYSVDPQEGAEISHLKSVTVTFNRAINAVGTANSAKILDANGNTVYNSVGFTADGKELSIRFRSGTLTAGSDYKLYIPQGMVAVADDATQTNSDIYIAYRGRKDSPVEVTDIYPEAGTAFSHIDYSTSPVMLTFDTDILITDTATASLYRNDEAEPYCSLTLARSGNRLALYPSTTQYLYEGSTYRVVVSQGAVTDMAGNNPNDAVSINYIGNYVRQIDADDVILFSDDFDSGLGNFMQYCGDQLTPTTAMQQWDFTTGMAWGLVREDNASADRKAASHSMYSPAGESDDWLVIPQTYIPDQLCSLKFLSQSYKNDKTDVLKVVVWESENVYNTLTKDIVDKMKAEGKVVYNEVQSPGANEESLLGEWRENKVSLADFAGKNIYIAFVNQNNNQSAVFMDSVEVRHDMEFLVSLNYEESVVSKDDISISGVLIGNSDKTFSNAEFTLKTDDGTVIDKQTATGMNLGKNEQYKFSFVKSLPVTVGQTNIFYVDVVVDGLSNSIKGSVKDLAFQPVKRVVLEEYTGRSCGNCPLGIIAIEKIQERYGDSFIPISIHTYNNDPLSNGLSNYTSSLGLDQLGAPSGMVNRNTGSYPAVSATVNDEARYFFTNTDPDLPDETDKLWMDYVNDEMAVPAESDISISSITYDEATMTFTAACDIKYALNATNQTVNLFTVLLEDNLAQAQSNYMASISSPDLGEWGLGGKYGQSVVQDFLNQDVCRNVNGTTIYGTGGYIPSTVTAGETYSASVSIANPYTTAVLNQCKVVVMMIDANTGKVINAACRKYSGSNGIEEIKNGNLNVADSPCYNLAGQRVNASAKGIIIINGKKYINK